MADFFLKVQLRYRCRYSSNDIISDGDSPILTLYIFIKKYCKYLWLMETSLSVLSNSSNEDILMGYHLSGCLILLYETSILKGNSWIEKLQKLQIMRVYLVHHVRACNYWLPFLRNSFICFSNVKLLSTMTLRHFSLELPSMEELLKFMDLKLKSDSNKWHFQRFTLKLV